MYNANKPDPSELPSTEQLLKSTLTAFVAAIVILVVFVLPAEYGIDPTRVGRVLGLTEMGEIKQQLQREKDDDEHGDAARSPVTALLDALEDFVTAKAYAQSPEPWKDVKTFTLESGEGYEIKMTMQEGASAEYQWSAEGGRINYDLHAHAGGKDARYKKGRGATEDSGAFTAKFDGDHGWFFRNRDAGTVTVILRLRVDYATVKRVE